MPPDRVPYAVAAGLLVVALFVSPTLAGPDLLPFGEVRAGMRGTGRTVFEGTDVAEFDVEILGTLPNFGPDQNLILVRLSGGPLERTGVLSGMSGSPVFVDGRLVGAVAYSWGFSSEAIAGVVPIEEMLAVTGDTHAAGAGRVGSFPAGDWAEPLGSAETLATFLADRRFPLASPRGSQRLALPLSIAGMGGLGFRRVGPALERLGFLPLQAGTAGADEQPAPALEPGSAVGIKLVRGDIDMTASGTVTWIDGDNLVAFGHPLFGLGAIDLPMTAARVEALLPSLFQSVRIATPIGEVGAARQDRAVGVAGVLGARPRMIPVRLRLAGSGPEHTFSFEIADDPLLSPLLLYSSLNGILASKERAFGNATVRLAEGSVIRLLDNEDVQLDNLFAGPRAFEHGTGIAAYILYLLMNNTWSTPAVAGVNLLMEYEDMPRTARVRRATLDRYRVAAGDALEVSVVLSPYRGPDRVIRREIVIPPETPPGEVTVSIGGALEVTREADRRAPLLPRDLDQLIRLVNQLRRNDGLYVVAEREDTGVLLHGARLPNLPPSVATVLTMPRSHGNYESVPRRTILEEFVTTDHAIEGSVRIQLEVEAP